MEKYEVTKTGRIQVNPEFLSQKSREIEGRCKRLEGALEEIREAAEGTKECFFGRSGEQFRKKIADRKREGEDIVRELLGLSVKLQEIAEEYALAERENRDVFGGN